MPAVTRAQRFSLLSGPLLALVLAAPGATAPWPAGAMAAWVLAATLLAGLHLRRRAACGGWKVELAGAERSAEVGPGATRRLGTTLLLDPGRNRLRLSPAWLCAADLPPGELRRLRVALECGAVPRLPR